VGHLGLAARTGQAVQSGESQILTDTGGLLPLGNVPVDEGDELKPLGQAPGGGEEAERLDACLEGLAGLLLESGEEGVGGAEMGQDDRAGSVEALGGDDLPVAAAVDDFSDNPNPVPFCLRGRGASILPVLRRWLCFWV